MRLEDFLDDFVEDLVEVFGVIAAGCDGEDEDPERRDISLLTSGRSVFSQKF